MVHCFLLKFKSDIRSCTLNYKTKALVYPDFFKNCRADPLARNFQALWKGLRGCDYATDITQTLWKNWVLFLLPKIFLNHKTQRWCANVKYLIFFTIKMSSSNFISNLLIFDDRMHMEYKCLPCPCKDIIQLVIKVKVNEILWGFFRNQKAGFSARLFEFKTRYILFFAPQEKLFVTKKFAEP